MTADPGFRSASARPATLVAAGLFSLLLAPVPAAGQEVPDTTETGGDTVQVLPGAGRDSTANFVGTVASRETGKPISGARVAIRELSFGAITNEEGKFEVRDLPPGMFDVRVHYLGYTTNQRPVRLEPGNVTRAVFLLERDVLEVADLKVTVKQRDRIDPMSDFKRRMERGFGEFITRREIEERNPQHTSDLFRTIPGLDVSPVQYGQANVYMRRAGQKCRPVVFLDGVLARNYAVDNLQPQSIEGIEVYRRASETPPQFTLSTERCGVLVIHTRTGGTGN